MPFSSSNLPSFRVLYNGIQLTGSLDRMQRFLPYPESKLDDRLTSPREVGDKCEFSMSHAYAAHMRYGNTITYPGAWDLAGASPSM